MYANIYYNGSLDHENMHATESVIRAEAEAMKRESPDAEITVWQTDDKSFATYNRWDDIPEDRAETYTL